MDKDFFVILTGQSGEGVGLPDEHGDLAFFATQEEAENAARNTFYGREFGWEVFERGSGLSDG